MIATTAVSQRAPTGYRMDSTESVRSGVDQRPFALLILVLCFVTNALSAQQPLEYDVKAAYLLNFTKFIEWPESAFADERSPFVICILGHDPFGRVLDNIVHEESVDHRRVVVRRIIDIPAPQTCQMVFVESASQELTKRLAAAARGMLTIGQGTPFVLDGGMIAFVVEDRKVRFDINQTAAENAGLKVSSKLLKVARTVVRE